LLKSKETTQLRGKKKRDKKQKNLLKSTERNESGTIGYSH